MVCPTHGGVLYKRLAICGCGAPIETRGRGNVSMLCDECNRIKRRNRKKNVIEYKPFNKIVDETKAALMARGRFPHEAENYIRRLRAGQ